MLITHVFLMIHMVVVCCVCFQHECHEPSVEMLQEDEPKRGVASWATSFEKLLGDPAGLHTFAVSIFKFLLVHHMFYVCKR